MGTGHRHNTEHVIWLASADVHTHNIPGNKAHKYTVGIQSAHRSSTAMLVVLFEVHWIFYGVW